MLAFSFVITGNPLLAMNTLCYHNGEDDIMGPCGVTECRVLLCFFLSRSNSYQMRLPINPYETLPQGYG